MKTGDENSELRRAFRCRRYSRQSLHNAFGRSCAVVTFGTSDANPSTANNVSYESLSHQVRNKMHVLHNGFVCIIFWISRYEALPICNTPGITACAFPVVRLIRKTGINFSPGFRFGQASFSAFYTPAQHIIPSVYAMSIPNV